MESIKKILRTPSAFVLFLVAIVSLIGVIIKNKSDEHIAQIPIYATVTAEARLTEIANISGSSQVIVAADTPIPTSTSIPMVEWKDIVEYSLLESPCKLTHATIVPESERWDRNVQLTKELLDKILNNQNTNKSEIAPIGIFEPLGRLDINLSVHSLVTTNDWIKLDNKVNFIVRPLPINIPEHLVAYYVYAGCGGEVGKSFSNPVVNLQTGVDEYQIGVSNTEYDFFTLHPGEYDEYEFSFSCTNPGIYQVILEQQYEFNGASDKISKDVSLIYCPKVLEVWTINAGSIQFTDGTFNVDESGIWGPDTYSWDGSKYSKP